jgi:uncharacterized protein (TIGR03086 family)
MNNAGIGERATEAVDFFIEAVEQIPSESWDLPSNLEGWRIRDLVAHSTGSAAKIVTLVEGGQIEQGPADPDDWRSEDPAGQLRELAVRLHDALGDADPDALRQPLAFPVCGLAIHAWDVYRSQDRLIELPEDLLAFCEQLAESVPEETLRRPGGFGPAQPVPKDATPTARLMAYFGRPVGEHDAPGSGVGTLASEAMGLLIKAVEKIPSESWDLPSNLEGWTIRDLVGHVTGSAAKIVTLVEGGEVWRKPSQPDDWKCEDPAAKLRELAARLQDALPGADLAALRPSPQGEVPLSRALKFPVSDLALHSWDIYRSQGRPVELPENLLAFCRELVEPLPEDMLRRPGGFGPAQPVPEDATPTARFMAYLGRSV